MRIKKIEKLTSGKYKIVIDDEKITTYDSVILDNNLLYKKNIDDSLYKKIIEDTKYYDNYNKAVKYILKKRRSEKEIREYLIKLKLNDVEIDKIVLKLKGVNLINDLEYCKAYINDSIYLSKNGINKIKSHLLNQNISIDIIEDILRDVDLDIFNNRLEKLIIKKINTNHKLSNSMLKHKILNEMINLGYDKDSIINIIEKNLIRDDSILKKEFDRVLKKLSNKYSGNELLKNVKQKLLLKGFSNDEINNLLKKREE